MSESFSRAARALRLLSSLLFCVVFALGAVTVRLVRDGKAELVASKKAFDAGELQSSILHARRAALAYVPGAPHVSQAYARLRAIAQGSERVGDRQTSRLAWGAMRGAALETQHLIAPRARQFEEASHELARLDREASEQEPAALGASKRWLEPPAAPRPGWALCVALGFAFAIGGLLWLGLGAVPPHGRVDARKLVFGVGLTLVGAGCWTLSLYLA